MYIIFTHKRRGGQTSSELLGSFSLYPARTGEVQTFVVPAPTVAAGVNRPATEIEVKLVPANPARQLGLGSLELLNAQIVK